MAGTALSQTWDLERCLAELRADTMVRRHALQVATLTLDMLAAELRGPAYVGKDRQIGIAQALRGLAASLEDINA